MKKNRREKKGIYVYIPLLLMMLSGGTSFVWGQPQVVGGDSDIVEKTYANGIHICGSRIHDRIAEGNRVVLTNRGDVHYVYGGDVDGEGTAQGNIVDLSSMTVQKIYGGKVYACGAAIGNKVELYRIRARGIYGGYIDSERPNVDVNGRVEGNEVTATDTVVLGARHMKGDIYGGQICGSGIAAGNRLILNNMISEDHGSIGGGRVESGAAIGNKVEINGGRFTCRMGKICGGCVTLGGTAQRNTVILNHVAVGEDFSSSPHVYGGQCGNGTVTENIVTLIGGCITESVYGGYITGVGGNATNNKVNIEGHVVIWGTVYGGCIRGEYFSRGEDVTITVTDPDTGRTFRNVRPPSECIEREGRGFRARIGDAFTGNELNLSHCSASVGTVMHFEYIRFFLSYDEFIADGACLTASKEIDLQRVATDLTMEMPDPDQMANEHRLEGLKGKEKVLMHSGKGKIKNFNPRSFKFRIKGNIDRNLPMPLVELSVTNWGKTLIARVKGLVLPEQPESGLLDRRPLLQTGTDPRHCCNVT